MSAKLLSRRLRSAIAKKKIELEACKVPACGFVVSGSKFDENLPEFVYQIIRVDLEQ